jgi:molybdate transport system substrate-binding protein
MDIDSIKTKFMKIFLRKDFYLAIAWLFLSTHLIGAEIKVQAAASLADVLKEIGSYYEKQSRDKMSFNFGASNLLARQIKNGAEADLFISADEATMDDLEKEGLVLKDTRKNLLSNRLAIVVSNNSEIKISEAKDLIRSEVKKIAIAEPQTVPAGIYAKAYLQKLNLWEQVLHKIVPTENVRGALAAVESENVEAAIVYCTDARISRKVKIAKEVSEEEGPKISYPIALLRNGKEIEAGKKFYSILFSSKNVFEKYGFIFIER